MSHTPTNHTEQVQAARAKMDAAWDRYTTADHSLAAAKREQPQPEDLDLLQDGLQDYYQEWVTARDEFNALTAGDPR